MEISPIIGIRMVPTIKARPAEPGITAEFDIQATSWLGEDSYNGSGKKAAGAEEPEEEALDGEEVLDTEEVGEFFTHGRQDAVSARISYFA